ncbi:protein of unknown function DUF928 [Leptolyngbyaceae cyanobacterium JSC-12]|nr:protein of unknown function DUF928 [Leptolyngbyaceae cyanobacterium JSC-12]
MVKNQPPSCLIALATTLLLGLSASPGLTKDPQILQTATLKSAVSASQPAVKQSPRSPVQPGSRNPKRFTFVLPTGAKSAPSDSVSGGRRNSGTCPSQQSSSVLTPETSAPFLTTLLPKIQLNERVVQLGQSVSEHPTLLVYIPQTTAKEVRFSLEDAQGKGLYRTALKVTGSPGVVSVPLPATSPGLEVGKEYRWVVSMICETAGPQNPFVEGIVRRVPLDTNLVKQLQQADPLEKAAIYARSGMWYEASASLFALSQSQPDNAELRLAWHELLQSVGLERMANTPLMNVN